MPRTYRKVGDKLYAEIQLGDGGDGGTTRVFAQLERPDGTILTAQFEIPHISFGKYREESKVMPDEDCVCVVYFIRKADGFTANPSYNPNYVVEVFLKDVTGQIVEDNLDQKVSSISICPVSIEAVITDPEVLSGAIESVVINGEIKDNEILTGVVDEC